LEEGIIGGALYLSFLFFLSFAAVDLKRVHVHPLATSKMKVQNKEGNSSSLYFAGLSGFDRYVRCLLMPGISI
jgi:hypothetical protein